MICFRSFFHRSTFSISLTVKQKKKSLILCSQYFYNGPINHIAGDNDFILIPGIKVNGIIFFWKWNVLLWHRDQRENRRSVLNSNQLDMFTESKRDIRLNPPSSMRLEI